MIPGAVSAGTNKCRRRAPLLLPDQVTCGSISGGTGVYYRLGECDMPSANSGGVRLAT